MKLNVWLNGLLGLFYPKLCPACGSRLSEQLVICMNCENSLPLTNFHLQADNVIAKQFWGRVEVEAVAACYYFTKGSKIQQLIHQLKYKGNQEVGELIGKLYGLSLKESVFDQIDLIIPVPLHPEKLKKRGFNQSTSFAKGLSEALQKPYYEDAVIRTSYTETQTKKSRWNRWLNVSEAFEVAQPKILHQKNILVVDDVITTGATMEALISKLSQSIQARFYVASIAYAGIS